MANFNRVILAGNLTRDPDLKYTSSGIPVCKFDLAINSSYTDKQGEKKEDTSFVAITVWRKQAETVAQYLKKGSSVLLEGRLKQERWETQELEKRSKIVVVASSVRFLSPKAQDEKTPAPADEDNAQPESEEKIPF